MVDSAYFVKSIPLRAFTVFFLIICRYVIDIFKMCMIKSDAEKNFDTLTGFFNIFRLST